MAITSAVCNTFKAELMKGGHNFNTSGQTPAGNAFNYLYIHQHQQT